MTFRVAHLTIKGGHAAEDWPTYRLAHACMERLKERDDIVCALVVDSEAGIVAYHVPPRIPLAVLGSA